MRGYHELKELPHPVFHLPNMKESVVQRPTEGLFLSFSEQHADIISLVALGGHSMLLAGPSGSGKTTMVKAIPSYLSVPRPEEILEIKKINKEFIDEGGFWRPVISPHHSSSSLAIVGGGVPPMPGEVSRAHRGVLIMDELLEFPSRVQEALREPMEEGALRLSRGNQSVRYPAQAQVLATTNLCPCGDFTPGCRASCRFSLLKCKSYSYRLSGPLVDRFEVLHFTEKKKSTEMIKVSGREILARLEKSWEWLKATGRSSILNSRRPLREIEGEVERFYFEHLMNKDMGSHRRHQATLRVGRTLADLECSPVIQEHHLEQALNWTWRPFERLRRWD